MTILADMISVFTPVLLVIHVAVCLLLCLVVLMQRPKQEGLGAAFGGGMTDQAFGARTTDVLQKGTVYLGTALFIITFVISVLVGSESRNSSIDLENTANGEKQSSEAAAILNDDEEESDDNSLSADVKKAIEGETPEETPADSETPETPAQEETPEVPAAEDTTQRDAATGAAVGAELGAIIGHQKGRALEGAAIGAAAGGVIAPEATPPAEIPAPTPAEGNSGQ